MRLFLLFIAGFSFQLNAQNVLIKNITVIPVHINTVWENQDVYLKDSEITKIKNHQPNQASEKDWVVIDGSGKYLIPAFADAHVHLPKQTEVKRFCDLNLLNGVCYLRSMRGAKWHLSMAKDSLSPQLFCSSPPIEYTDSLNAEQWDSLVAAYKDLGYDFIKLLSIKDQASFEMLTKAARAQDMPLSGHCPRNIPFEMLCKSQQFQSVEHLSGILTSSDKIALLRNIHLAFQHHIYHCPTLNWIYSLQLSKKELLKQQGLAQIPQSWKDRWNEEFTSSIKDKSAEEIEAYQEKLHQIYQSRLDYLGYLYKQGGQLLVGPDASAPYNVPGYSYHDELAHFAKAGISNQDILKAACYNLAEMLGQTDRWGCIKIGASPNMLLLNANPLENIENAKQLDGIILNGFYFSKDQLITH